MCCLVCPAVSDGRYVGEGDDVGPSAPQVQVGKYPTGGHVCLVYINIGMGPICTAFISDIPIYGSLYEANFGNDQARKSIVCYRKIHSNHSI